MASRAAMTLLSTDAVVADIEAEAVTNAPRTRVAESFDAELWGIPTPVSVHRLIKLEANWSWRPGQAPKKMIPSSCPISV
jgi:hypothetical protein